LACKWELEERRKDGEEGGRKEGISKKKKKSTCFANPGISGSDLAEAGIGCPPEWKPGEGKEGERKKNKKNDFGPIAWRLNAATKGKRKKKKIPAGGKNQMWDSPTFFRSPIVGGVVWAQGKRRGREKGKGGREKRKKQHRRWGASGAEDQEEVLSLLPGVGDQRACSVEKREKEKKKKKIIAAGAPWAFAGPLSLPELGASQRGRKKGGGERARTCLEDK